RPLPISRRAVMLRSWHSSCLREVPTMEKTMPRGIRHAWTFILALTWVSAALVPISFLVASPASAQSVEQFYKGRRLTMLVGSAVGGGYDAYARMWSRHL